MLPILALSLSCFADQGTEARRQAPPSEIYGEFFEAVQASRLFPDSKAFADAVPREEPAHILAAWRSERDQPGFSLRQFVQTHFEQEPAVPPLDVYAHQDLCQHIAALWSVLTRAMVVPKAGSSLLRLPNPAIVPGGRFREVYYWDSYFSLLGPAASGRRQLVVDMINNFADLIDRYGFVPNGTRSYYLSRSQPPFFYEMVALLSEQDPAGAYARYLPQLRREHAFWMEGEHEARLGAPHRRVVALAGGARLNRYWDDRAAPRDEAYREDLALARASGRPAAGLFRDIRAAAESGWDFSSRWLADGHDLASIETTQIIPVDLNSLLYGLETAIRLGCLRAGDAACVDEFTARAVARKAAIDRYLWQKDAGYYDDYDWRRQRVTGRLSAATLYPLFVSVASREQGHRVARMIQTTLLRAAGLAATPLHTGQQWDLPNGWAPLQWIAVRGLRAYGEPDLARDIAERWLANVQRVYRDSGKLVEKYDVVDPSRAGGGGEYPLQDGFGWTNGVTVQLLRVYPEFGGACTSSAPADLDANTGIQP